jgi:hypothetical protein
MKKGIILALALFFFSAVKTYAACTVSFYNHGTTDPPTFSPGETHDVDVVWHDNTPDPVHTTLFYHNWQGFGFSTTSQVPPSGWTNWNTGYFWGWEGTATQGTTYTGVETMVAPVTTGSYALPTDLRIYSSTDTGALVDFCTAVNYTWTVAGPTNTPTPLATPTNTPTPTPTLTPTPTPQSFYNNQQTDWHNPANIASLYACPGVNCWNDPTYALLPDSNTSISNGSNQSNLVMNYTFTELPSDAYINYILLRIKGNSTGGPGVVKLQAKPGTWSTCTTPSGYFSLTNQLLTLQSTGNFYVSGSLNYIPGPFLRNDLNTGNTCFMVQAGTNIPTGLPIGADVVQAAVNYSSYISAPTPTPIIAPPVIPSPSPIPSCGTFDIKCNIWNAFYEFFQSIFGFNLLFDPTQYTRFADLFNARVPFGYMSAFYLLDFTPHFGLSTDIPDLDIPITVVMHGTPTSFGSIHITGHDLYIFKPVLSVIKGYLAILISLLFLLAVLNLSIMFL